MDATAVVASSSSSSSTPSVAPTIPTASSSKSAGPPPPTDAPLPPLVLGPHLFPKENEGALEFHSFLMKRYPALWLKGYKAPLICSKNRLNWSPPEQKEMDWGRMCGKLTSWYWANEKTLVGASKKQFPKLFWKKYCEELHPKTTTKAQIILFKMYDNANLVVEDMIILD